MSHKPSFFFIHFKKHKNAILLLSLSTNIGFTNTTDINWTVRNDKQITYKISYLLNYTNVFVYLRDICIWDDRNLRIWNEDRSFHSSFDMNKLTLKGYIYIFIKILKAASLLWIYALLFNVLLMVYFIFYVMDYLTYLF